MLHSSWTLLDIEFGHVKDVPFIVVDTVVNSGHTVYNQPRSCYRRCRYLGGKAIEVD